MKMVRVIRKKGEPFLCPKCQQPMTHDEAYKHWAQKCPKRKAPHG